jgi:hypothetical protein
MPKSKPKRVQRIPGYVWCDRDGSVHEDSLDPYGYGPPKPGEDDDRCQPEDHRSVLILARVGEFEAVKPAGKA